MASNGTDRRIGVGQFGTQLMRYWPAILVFVALIGAGAEVRLRVNQHGKTLDAVLMKLETNIADREQWKVLRVIGKNISDLEARAREIEKHITPDSIQKWGKIQSMVDEDHKDLKNHLRGHP